MEIWLPVPLDESVELDVDILFFIHSRIRDQFFKMIQTKESLKSKSTKNWKQFFSGVYEVCVIYKTTILNLHYACGSCGYMAFCDCYKTRMPTKKEILLSSTTKVLARDLFLLELCNFFKSKFLCP
jgi:lysine-specific demethylase 3